MKNSRRSLLLLLPAGVLTALIAGCSPEEQAAFDRYCAQNQIDCAAVVARWQASQGQAGGPGAAPAPAPDSPVPAAPPVAAVAVHPNELPAELKEWANERQAETEPAGKAMTVGDQTYVAVTGGMQRTGGYRLEYVGARRENGTWLVQTRLVPPPPGSMVTMALQNPVGFYRLSRLEGQVEVKVQPAAASR